MIETQKLVKRFKNGPVVTEVLRGIDLKVEKGEFLAIMGRSGAGKSTLMYQMSLLDVPSGGAVIIDDLDTKTLSRKKRTQYRLHNLGFVFQDYALLPELSAVENVMIPLLMQGKSPSDAELQAKESLDRIDLSERYGNLPSQLSGGEQQRVSIARAIVARPKILFADEPTANLDSVSAKAVIRAIEDIHTMGQTTVMVTHERQYAEHADRIIFLDDGQIVKEERL